MEFSVPCAKRLVQRFALPALGRAAERRPNGKMLRRRKMLENGAESPASGARFVGLPACLTITFCLNITDMIGFRNMLVYKRFSQSTEKILT